MPGTALVVGGDSLIGENIVRTLCRGGVGVEYTTRRPDRAGIAFDLARPDLSVFKLRRLDFVIFCAAVTSMAACEASPEATHAVNVTGTLAAIRAATEAGAHVVYFSSSQVFDGDMPLATESTPPSPKNFYGRQKLEVERAIEREKLPAAVVRVTKVLSNRPAGMFHDWNQNLTQGKAAVAATNMTLAPVSAQASADLAVRLAQLGHTGIWHLSSVDEMPYYDAALMMADICKLPRRLVRGEAVTEQQVPGIYRHRYTALSAKKASRLPGILLKTAAETLTALFETLSLSDAQAVP